MMGQRNKEQRNNTVKTSGQKREQGKHAEKTSGQKREQGKNAVQAKQYADDHRGMTAEEASMGVKYKNVTNLTLDMYMQGIKESYRQRNKIGRAVSYAYAIIMAVIACAFFLSREVPLGSFFVFCSVIILFWNLKGYRLGTKGSFLEFARLHGSHYQVEMAYRFYEDRLEQETDKTELAVPYQKIKGVYETEKGLLFYFDGKVIIMDKLSFIDCQYGDVIKFIQEKNVKVHAIT